MSILQQPVAPELSKNVSKRCREYYQLSIQIQFGTLDRWEEDKGNQTVDQKFSCRAVCLCEYGKNKTLHFATLIGDIKESGTMALLVLKEKRKKAVYVVCTNL